MFTLYSGTVGVPKQDTGGSKDLVPCRSPVSDSKPERQSPVKYCRGRTLGFLVD